MKNQQSIYDAQVVTLDQETQQATFMTASGSQTFKLATEFYQEGQYGVLTLTQGGGFLSFRAYVEQRLRRYPEGDFQGDEERGIKPFWSWRLEGSDDCINCQPHFVPGHGGKFIKDATTPVEIALPPEFMRICESIGLPPEQVLQGFVADLCGLMNYLSRPREDGLSSNGSDERMYARQWFDRAYHR